MGDVPKPNACSMLLPPHDAFFVSLLFPAWTRLTCLSISANGRRLSYADRLIKQITEGGRVHSTSYAARRMLTQCCAPSPNPTAAMHCSIQGLSSLSKASSKSRKRPTPGCWLCW